MDCLYTDNNNDFNKNNIELEENIFDNSHNNTQYSSSLTNLKIQKIFNFMLIGLFTIFCIFCLFSENSSYSSSIRNNQEIINETEFNINDTSKIKNEKYEDKIKFSENYIFNSFQCKKKSFTSIILDEANDIDWIQEKKNNINNDNSKDKSENKIKNPIYFKLFVQSCSLDEEPENNINNNKEYNSFNDNMHYILSTDKTTYRDFYFYCKLTDN